MAGARVHYSRNQVLVDEAIRAGGHAFVTFATPPIWPTGRVRQSSRVERPVGRPFLRAKIYFLQFW